MAKMHLLQGMMQHLSIKYFKGTLTSSYQRTKSDKYAASGAEMEKLINMESQLLFQIERKISELPKQTNPLTKIQVESLINAIAKLEDERNLSKVGFQNNS